MSAHVKLVDIPIVPGGFRVPTATCQLGDAAYEFPLPGHRLGEDVIVRPTLEPEENAKSVRIRFDKWWVHHEPMRKVLPISFGGMTEAIRGARAFEADRGIEWDSPDAEIWSWSMAWIEQTKARGGGDR